MDLKIALIILLIISLMPLHASAGCGRWVVTDNTDYLADPAFDAAIEGSTVSAETVPSEQLVQGDLAGSDNASGPDSQNTSGLDSQAGASSAVASAPEPLDVSGSWSFSLNESQMELILIQSEDSVQGYGNIEDRGHKSPLTARGSVSNEDLSLEVKLVSGDPDLKIDEKYSIDLAISDMTISNQTLSGVYESYVDGNLVEKGTAIATKGKIS